MSVQLAYRNLVRAIEVWEYDEERDSLVWSSGSYGEMQSMLDASKRLEFPIGTGLPGLAWQNRSPVIMHQLDTGEFVRAEAARESGVTCGIGLPFFHDGKIRAVLVFLCDAGSDVQGAFEIWRVNDRFELGLEASYYANLNHFAALSHFIRFPRGAGLPGQAWQMRFPRLIDSLTDSPSFMRASGARVEGLQVGLAIPIMHDSWTLDSVVVMLSSAYTPLAKFFEVWIPDSDMLMSLHSSVFGGHNELERMTQSMRLRRGEGFAGVVATKHCPVVTTDIEEFECSRADALRDAGVTTAASLPVHIGPHLVAVVNLFLE